MAISACTSSIYTTTVVGYVPGTGDTVGTVVTFNTPTPVWSNTTGGTIYECNAVTLGGFNGLNN
jgi:hypothetical protein